MLFKKKICFYKGSSLFNTVLAGKLTLMTYSARPSPSRRQFSKRLSSLSAIFNYYKEQQIKSSCQMLCSTYTYLLGTLQCFKYYKMICVYASQCSTSFAGLDGKSSFSFRVSQSSSQSGAMGHDSRESSLLYLTRALVIVRNKNGIWQFRGTMPRTLLSKYWNGPNHHTRENRLPVEISFRAYRTAEEIKLGDLIDKKM